MRRGIIMGAVVSLLGLGVAGAGGREEVVLAAGEVRWEDFQERPGMQYANLWGDIKKGAYGALVRLPAGESSSLHAHGSSVKWVVISGTLLYEFEDGSERVLGPGSHLVVPIGVPHRSGCKSEEPCVLFQESGSRFDFRPAARN